MRLWRFLAAERESGQFMEFDKVMAFRPPGHLLTFVWRVQSLMLTWVDHRHRSGQLATNQTVFTASYEDQTR